MLEQSKYEQELRKICVKMKKSFSIKINLISALFTNRNIKKIIKLNNKTKNANINELLYALGRTNLEYRKYCYENNYYTDPYINKKIKQAYSKLSRKLMKIETNKSFIKKKNVMVELEYNSDRGTYIYKNMNGSTVVSQREYKINDIKNLEEKRKDVIRRLNQYNFGINVFDELGLDDRKINKLNPDVIQILLNEGKILQAKMYIKEVIGGEKINKSLKVKYVLNRNLKKGVFSPEENKNMKKMAKADRIANELTIFSEKRAKKIAKHGEKQSIFKRIITSIFNTSKATSPANCIDTRKENSNEFERRANIITNNLKNSNTGKISAYSNTQDFRRANIQKFDYINAQTENKLENAKKFINTKTGKTVAYSKNPIKDKTALKKLINTKTGNDAAYVSNPEKNRKEIKRLINTNTGKFAAYEAR